MRYGSFMHKDTTVETIRYSQIEISGLSTSAVLGRLDVKKPEA